MQNYSVIQKLLHDLVLGQKFINKSLFELEKIFFLKNQNINNNNHIFISGLPRSGTTSLLNFIYSSNDYASIKYLNIPFVLSPNLSKLFNKKNFKSKKRLHSDKIMFDLNSPEAFDEVFLDNNEIFIKNEFINYLNLILLSEKKDKYLSKNNHNYKRIELIRSMLPNSIFLIPIREPLQHAYSLLSQHLHFIKLQKKNDFIRRYMNYLGHNEFGLNHKAWNKPINYHDLNNINYWIEQWLLFYQNIINNYQSYKNCFFVVYEELSNPSYLKSLLKNINLSNEDNVDLSFFTNSNQKKINVKYDVKTYNDAITIYKNFLNFKN